MKTNEPRPFFLILFLVYLMVTYTCKKLEKSMLVSTGEVTNIETNSAEASGMVVDLGEGATQHGHCYGTSPNVTIAGSKTQLGTPPTGGFTSQVTNLTAGTKYYIKAYISNGSETVYGKEISFTTVTPSEPVITTATVTEITTMTAVCGGYVTSDGGSPVTARGVCWGTSAGPTTEGSKTSDGNGTGVFTSNLTGLTPNTNYYIRAYATSVAGTGYGDEVSFKTIAATPPSLTTSAITDITQTTATGGGNITSDGGVPVTMRGVCWNTSGSPTTADSKTEDGEGPGNFVSSLTGLTGNTTYYVRAYATNSAGTSYGDEKSFKTGAVLPILTTTAITSVTSTGAVSGGNITDNGGSPVTARGVCWSTSPLPTTGNTVTSNGTGSGNFISNITGLSANTKYYVRSYATNSVGTAYGNELNFTTITSTTPPPTAAAAAATSVTNTAATINGAVNANGTSTTVTFEYGPTTLYGSVKDATPSVVTGTSTTSVSASLTGLTPGTLIHYRVKAINEGGTAYSDDLTFTTTQVPDAITEPATLITTVSATLNATVNANNLSTNVTFEYGTTIGYGNNATAVPNPVSGGTPTAVSYELTGLLPNTTYHFRVKAASTGGTIYGEDKTFVTNCTSPSATTNTSSLINASGSTLNGTVNANGFSTVVTFEYGLTGTYGNTIAASQSPVSGSMDVDVDAAIGGLTSNSLYHYRVKAVNCSPTPVYGSDMTFITLATVTTGPVTDITTFSASCGGDVDPNFGPEDVTSRGVCWSTSPNPTTADNSTVDGSGFGSFTSSLTGLTSNTVYYVRAYAINPGGTAYGEERSFTTLANVTTSGISNITDITASSGGNIDLGGGGSIIERGVCWSTSINPTLTDDHSSDGAGTGIFNSYITGLNNYTNYYIRAYATNGSGTSYGNQIDFKTLCGISLTVTHSAGNIAPVTKTVTYGLTENFARCWITQNLGADNQASSATDATENAAGWYWQFNRKQGYKHDGTNRTPSGTWETPIDENSDWTAANDPCAILLGTGWRIPTFTDLTNYIDAYGLLNISDAYSSVLKFHAAGILYGGSLNLRGTDAWTWSNTQSLISTIGMSIRIQSGSCGPNAAGKDFGFTIRCLKYY